MEKQNKQTNKQTLSFNSNSNKKKIICYKIDLKKKLINIFGSTTT